MIAARLNPYVSLEGRADGAIVAEVSGQPIPLGRFGEGVIGQVPMLRAGLPLAGIEPDDPSPEAIGLLIRRLARRGLLEYALQAADGAVTVTVEPQMAEYWPLLAPLAEDDRLALSRFAYLRRRGPNMVLESPLSGALFRIEDTRIAPLLLSLSEPQRVDEISRLNESESAALLGLLLAAGILFKSEPEREGNPRHAEGDEHLALWDFHDLLFHTRSTEGRHANPLGSRYPHLGVLDPLPALRPDWPGTPIDLKGFPGAPERPSMPLARAFEERVSARDFDASAPITLAELAQFLERSARVRGQWQSTLGIPGDDTVIEYTVRPYPGAGAGYELELYLVVERCAGLEPGFYHYGAGNHVLVPIPARPRDVAAALETAKYSLDVPDPPQIVVMIAARFGRISWKYSTLAYELILKNVGVLTQTFYLAATDLGLGGCAIGGANIDLFARMTGLPFHVEGAVGQFALGRPVPFNPA